ncbi:unnamed protein product [Dovyalis caffra]|uniref:Peptidase C1A papain C-terminal domain-containing protein n=1 Tax=Dovyalis caffra TaxID=77055 RepID=A0AAV1RV80_9ROSI|nr:unnamed protein product [Dovyalis caffra]
MVTTFLKPFQPSLKSSFPLIRSQGNRRDSSEFVEKQQQPLRLSLRKWVNGTCSTAVFPQIDGCRWLVNYPNNSPRKVQVYASGPGHFYPNLDTLPESVDWRSKGAIMKIKDQTDTNSCTAQTLTSCMESLIFIQTGEKVILSAKEIVDCCEEFDFEAGLYDIKSAYDYIGNNGVCLEADYPWTKYYSPCRFDAFNSKEKFYIDGYATVPVQDESWMELAIAQQPVAVELWLVKEDYESYKEGIYSTEYKFEYVLHMMAAIGYNSKAWIFLNSRGVGYGVDGYMYVKRGMDFERYPEGIGRVCLNVTYPIM